MRSSTSSVDVVGEEMGGELVSLDLGWSGVSMVVLGDTLSLGKGGMVDRDVSLNPTGSPGGCLYILVI